MFDRSGQMAPGEYQLGRPHKSATRAEITKRWKGRKHNRNGTKAVKRGMKHMTSNVRSLYDPDAEVA